ncbi:MAG: hypothetical protein QOD00_3107 [Blastocatellia bacterium]|jgi:hypothetical protein|nr:hypothetical protein [Blastocatellia bacterium]
MAENYLIAIGGTGSRCMESVIYLAAAGLFQIPMRILIIDPDQNNGNSVKARTLVTTYHALHLARQPSQAEKRNKYFGWTRLQEPTLFQASLNVKSGDASAQHSIFWNNPNSASRRFGEIIQYQTQKEELKNFLDLFYESADLEMVLDVGYRGRTNVGAVALKQDLEGTANLPQGGLREFLERLNIDLQTKEARVFVMGSVFGGTGAAGLPTVPQLIENLPADVMATDNRTRIRYGCAMMTPYFSFPKSGSSASAAVTGPGTDSARHAVATQAALLHYAHVPPGYQHIYFIGAPARPQTNSNNIMGGENQTNDPHYAELIAALAAWQFFVLPQIPIGEKQLHFADTMQDKIDVGVNWKTLPVNPNNMASRDQIKRDLTIFTTLTYFYKNFLYNRFINGQLYRDANWYKDNFGQLSLDEEIPSLQYLYEFSKSYLAWLAKMGETGKNANLHLFQWMALTESDPALADRYVSSLLDDPASSSAHRAQAGFNDIYARLDRLKLRQPGTNSATGLFLLMLHHAVSEFCYENYAWG